MPKKDKSYQISSVGNIKLPQKHFFSNYFLSPISPSVPRLRVVSSVLSWADETPVRAGCIRACPDFPFAHTLVVVMVFSAPAMTTHINKGQAHSGQFAACPGIIHSSLLMRPGRAGESPKQAAARPSLQTGVDARCAASVFSLDSTGRIGLSGWRAVRAARCRCKAGAGGNGCPPRLLFPALLVDFTRQRDLVRLANVASNARRAA